MKKIIATLLVAVASIGSTAMAGDWYLGGNVGFMHNESNSSKTNEFSLLPEFGYNFDEHWAIGGVVGYRYLNNATVGTNLNEFKINPYVRWTFFRTSNNLVQLFLDGSVGFGVGSTSYPNDYYDKPLAGTSKTAATWEIGIKPGIALNVTDHFSIVAHVGFAGYQGANDHAKHGGAVEKGGVMIDSSNLTFGLYYTF